MDKLPFGTYDFFGYVAPGLLVVAGLEWTFGYPHVLAVELKPTAIALLLLAVYVAGHIIAGPSRTILEDWFVGRWLHGPSLALLASKRRRVLARIFPGYFTTLPPEVCARIAQRANREGCNGTGERLFLHARFHDETLKNERLMQKLDTFVRLYGFARNMAFTSLVVAMALATKVASGHGAPHDGSRTALLAVAGVLLVYRYLKFYRQYSFELLNNYGSYREA